MPLTPEIERHPLQPFLPENARILMLGSFPPPTERWCMDFFYPNPQNDMWRIMGQVFFADKQHFVDGKVFRYDEIISFCRKQGIAIFDTAQTVRRLQGNAADEHLEIVERTNIAAILQQIPQCHDICCTGGKAAETLAEILHTATPKVGEYIETSFADRTIRFLANAFHFTCLSVVLRQESSSLSTDVQRTAEKKNRGSCRCDL